MLIREGMRPDDPHRNPRLALALAVAWLPGCSLEVPSSWRLESAPGGSVDVGSPGAGAAGGGESLCDAGGGGHSWGDAGTAPDAGSAPDAGTADGGVPDEGPGPVVVPPEGGTTLRGILAGTLTASGSPYRVVGDEHNVATVPKGQTLTIGPGVIVDFVGSPVVSEADTTDYDEVMHHQAGRVELRVFGRMVVQGAPGSLAILTSTNPYGWWGINFFGADSVGDGDPVFDHMLFEKVRKNAYNGSRQFTRGAIWAYYPGGPVTLSHSILRDNVSAAKCGAIDLMYTNGSLVDGNRFENNRTSEIDRFGQAGSRSLSGGGAMCITHGRNSLVRGNRFRANVLESSRGLRPGALTPRPFTTWPNSENQQDLGGGAAIHYFQPDGDRVEGNLFEDNVVRLGPGAAIYVEGVPFRGLTLRDNELRNNRAGTGGVIVCNRGSGGPQLVVDADNRFSGNATDVGAAPDVSGDCQR